MDPVTVLVVDDEHNVRDSVESILGSDYAVMRVDNGDAAGATIYEESDQIELLILDLGLPGMSGYEALAESIGLLRGGKPIEATIALAPINWAMEGGAMVSSGRGNPIGRELKWPRTSDLSFDFEWTNKHLFHFQYFCGAFFIITVRQ